jgi:hypothetical protein
MNEPATWKDLRWIEPQSRWVLSTLFKRDLNVMQDSARRTVNWIVLGVDVAVVWLILESL